MKVDVPLYRQETDSSCWWTAMRMVLAHAGRQFTLPGSYRFELAPAWSRPYGRLPGPFPDYETPSTADQLAILAEDGTNIHYADTMVYLRLQQDERRLGRRAFNDRMLTYLAPHEWYRLGIPNDRRIFRRFQEITEFRTVSDQSMTSGLIQYFESKLTRFGPLIININMPRSGTHWVVVVGASGGDLGAVTVADPATGGEAIVSESELCQRMMGPNSEQGSMFPLYLPEHRPLGT